MAFSPIDCLASLDPKCPLAVATFNVKRFSSAKDAAERLPGLVAHISQLVPNHDLLCLQEVSLPLYEWLAAQRGTFVITGVCDTLEHTFRSDESCAVSVIVLCQRALRAVPNALERQEIRIVEQTKKCIVADVLLVPGVGQNKKGGHSVRVANVHLPADDPTECRSTAHGRRRDEALLVLRHCPDILAGDFNFDDDEDLPPPGPQSPLLVDSSASSGPTFGDSSRLDRVYLRPALVASMSLQSVAVIDTTDVSDHRCVSISIAAPPVVVEVACEVSVVPPPAEWMRFCTCSIIACESVADSATDKNFHLSFTRNGACPAKGKLEIELKAKSADVKKLSTEAVAFKQSELNAVKKVVVRALPQAVINVTVCVAGVIECTGEITLVEQ